jgi:hypothetical protein
MGAPGYAAVGGEADVRRAACRHRGTGAVGAQAWAVSLFRVLYGLSNGVLTILRRTLPQSRFGRGHFSAIS